MKTIKIISAAAAVVITTAAWAAPYQQLRLTGRVTSEGKPVAGVPVTDGTQFVTTDASGRYAMMSDTASKHVYITLPAGYEVPVQDGVPVLYADIKPDAKGRFAHDFSLVKSARDMDRHILFVSADPQVYFDPNLDEVKAASLEMKQLLADEYPGQDAIQIICGDVIGRYNDGEKYYPWMIENIAATGFPTFYVCGNHDIEMDVPFNEQSRKAFNRYFGPTYYSFNRGKVHYVVLDDVYWMGRYYAGYFPERQLEWLKRDLSFVPDGSMVIVSMHIPCYSPAARDKEWGKESYHKVVSNRQALFSILKPFNAHIMSGHEHYNENYVLADNLYEHNHAALSNLFWCAPWCWDGTPGGYAVYEIDGDKIDWYYKSLGRGKEYQMNLYPRGASREHPEAIVANIWNIDSTWKVEWFEDGTPKGEMIRYTGYDPNIWNDVVANGKDYAFPYIGAVPTAHMLYAVPERDNSVITVKATDHNGHVYTQTLDQSKTAKP